MKRLLFLVLAAQPLLAADFRDPQAVAAAALDSHPRLVELRAAADAARERVRPASALPDPMLMAGVQNKQIDLRDDEMMTMYMVGASQRLVRPGKREASRDIASLAADAASQEISIARAEIERDVLLAWYGVALADARIAGAAGVREMIDAVIAAARVRYEVGNALQSEVIRAQLQLADLDHEILRLRGARRAAAARLLAIAGMPQETEVPALTLPANEPAREIDGPSTPPAAHAAIAALEMQAAAAEAEIRLARAALIPDIDIEAQYGYRAMQRDMFSVTARIELPLRQSERIEPRVREAILRRDAALSRIDALRRELTAAMSAAVVAHEEANSQMQFHQGVLVPQAQLAFESTLAAYQTGAASFDAILTTETFYLRSLLQYYDYLERHVEAIVNYEALSSGARSAAMTGGATGAPASAAPAATPSAMSTM